MKTAMLALLIVVVSLSGCASVPGQSNESAISVGRIVGTVGGAMAGAALCRGGKTSELGCGLAGAAVGNIIGGEVAKAATYTPTASEFLDCDPGFEKGQFVEPRIQDKRICLLRPEHLATFAAFKCDPGQIPAILPGDKSWCVHPGAVVYLERDTRQAGYTMSPGEMEAYARGQAAAAGDMQRRQEREAYKAGKRAAYLQNNYREVPGGGGATEASHLRFPAQPGARWAFK